MCGCFGGFEHRDDTEADADFALDEGAELFSDEKEVVAGGEVDGEDEVVDVLAEGVELAGVDSAEELSRVT